MRNAPKFYAKSKIDTKRLSIRDTEDAKKVFDENLAIKFAPAIRELEGLGYPGVANPKLTIVTKMTTGEALKHDSTVQYALSKNDDTLKLPEKYT